MHILVPVALALAIAIYGARQEFTEFLVVLFGGALFYCAPYLCWLAFQLAVKPSSIVLHAGYIGASLALFLIASLWLLPPDQSGLPIQWMAYWPLAAMLIILLSGLAYLFSRLRSS